MQAGHKGMVWEVNTGKNDWQFLLCNVSVVTVAEVEFEPAEYCFICVVLLGVETGPFTPYTRWYPGENVTVINDYAKDLTSGSGLGDEIRLS